MFRWYREHRGTIERTTGMTPPDSSWIRGMGPCTPALKAQRKAKLQAIHCGIPKSEEHKQRMRDAKLGIPKTMEHREAKRRAALYRVELIRQVMAEQNIGWFEALPLVPRKTK